MTVAKPIEVDELVGDYRLSVEQYHAMIKAGVLGPDDRIELLEGFLVRKMSKGPEHEWCVERLYDLLRDILYPRYRIRQQSAVTLVDSEPEPDLFVFENRDAFRDRLPGLGDLVLVIEVSDSSLRRDRGTKQRIYANAKVPAYWIVNLIDRRVEVYANPGGEGEAARYAEPTIYTAGQSVPILGKSIAVDAVLPG